MDFLNGDVGTALDDLSRGFRDLHIHLDEITWSSVAASADRSDQGSSAPGDVGATEDSAERPDRYVAGQDITPAFSYGLAGSSFDVPLFLPGIAVSSSEDSLSEGTRALLDNGHIPRSARGGGERHGKKFGGGYPRRE